MKKAVQNRIYKGFEISIEYDFIDHKKLDGEVLSIRKTPWSKEPIYKIYAKRNGYWLPLENILLKYFGEIHFIDGNIYNFKRENLKKGSI